MCSLFSFIFLKANKIGKLKCYNYCLNESSEHDGVLVLFSRLTSDINAAVTRIVYAFVK